MNMPGVSEAIGAARYMFPIFEPVPNHRASTNMYEAPSCTANDEVTAAEDTLHRVRQQNASAKQYTFYVRVTATKLSPLHQHFAE